MERMTSKFQISKELYHNGALYFPGYDELVTRGMIQEIAKEIHNKVEIDTKDNKEEYRFDYSTEFYLMKPEEIKDILECLRRIYAIGGDNYHIQTNVKEIAKICGLS